MRDAISIKEQIINTKLDSATGEVLEQEINKTLRIGTEPSYVKLYLQDIMYLSDMPQQYAAVTRALLQHVTYAGGEEGMCVVLAPMIKRKVCEVMGWKKTQTLNNALQKLCKGKILYHIDRGVYQFNPYLFGKGDWTDISNLRLTIDYSEIEGRTFAVNVRKANSKAVAQDPNQTSLDLGEVV